MTTTLSPATLDFDHVTPYGTLRVSVLDATPEHALDRFGNPNAPLPLLHVTAECLLINGIAVKVSASIEERKRRNRDTGAVLPGEFDASFSYLTVTRLDNVGGYDGATPNQRRKVRDLADDLLRLATPERRTAARVAKLLERAEYKRGEAEKLKAQAHKLFLDANAHEREAATLAS